MDQQNFQQRFVERQEMPLTYSPPTSNYENYHNPLYAAMAAFRTPYGPPPPSSMSNQQFVSSTTSNGYSDHYQFPHSAYNQALFHAQVSFCFDVKFVTRWLFINDIFNFNFNIVVRVMLMIMR